jgi:2-octaprenyl-6-methoxyphenol hydroxylase
MTNGSVQGPSNERGAPVTDCDVCVAGGGMAGASLACALSGRGMRVVVVDAAPAESSGASSIIPDRAVDARPIALAHSSRCILEAIGVWRSMESQVTPIRSIHVSDQGGFGTTRLEAGTVGLDALGYVVEASVLRAALRLAMAGRQDVEAIAPARVVGLRPGAATMEVSVRAGGGLRRLRARLVVAADGGDSSMRALTGIPVERYEYHQVAIAATVTPMRGHGGVAYERFTPSGPLALLPLSEDRCGLIWTAKGGDAQDLLALDDRRFLEALQSRFGGRMGGFAKVGPRRTFRLALVRAREQVRHRLVLLGNSAHTLHPVAGQGFNLALRDTAALAELVTESFRHGGDAGARDGLRGYERWRWRDQWSVIAFTDGLVRLFSNSIPPARVVRNLGLFAFDLMPPVKRGLVRRATGLVGRLPRLARGVPLA